MSQVIVLECQMHTHDTHDKVLLIAFLPKYLKYKPAIVATCHPSGYLPSNLSLTIARRTFWKLTIKKVVLASCGKSKRPYLRLIRNKMEMKI